MTVDCFPSVPYSKIYGLLTHFRAGQDAPPTASCVSPV